MRFFIFVFLVTTSNLFALAYDQIPDWFLDGAVITGFGSYKKCPKELRIRVHYFKSKGAIVEAPLDSPVVGDKNADFVLLKQDIEQILDKYNTKFNEKLTEKQFQAELTAWQLKQKYLPKEKEVFLKSVYKELQEAVFKKVNKSDFVYIMNLRYCDGKDFGENWTGKSTDTEFGYAIGKNILRIFENEGTTEIQHGFGIFSLEDLKKTRQYKLKYLKYKIKSIFRSFKQYVK